MRKFAKLEYGRVTDIFEEESKERLALIFGPKYYWVDVTDMDVKPGYITKFVEGQGIVFVDPSEKNNTYTIAHKEEAVKIKLEYLGSMFAKERDKVRFITLKEAVMQGDAVADPAIVYGFDCTKDAIMGFMAAFTPLLIARSGSTPYKVWLSDTEKGIVELTYENMQKAYTEIRNEQLFAYAKYEEKRKEVLAAKSIQEIIDIAWDDETPPIIKMASNIENISESESDPESDEVKAETEAKAETAPNQ